jgi:[protein-PII] uridylyltransferase
VFVATRWQPDRSTVSVAVGTRESVAPGVFHRVTGALTSQRMEILAADIHTLEDGLVIDHFTLVDPDFAGAPPADRLADVAAAIRAALKADRAPAFIPRINPLAPRLDPALRHPVRVAIDNTSSDTSTIIDVFANDALGLLYQIARTLFDAGLSVRSAKVGTYLDQVVDCFHVTDSDGGKIVDPERLESIRRRLEAVVAKATER